MNNIIICIYF